MTPLTIFLLVLYALCMASGQLLFKLAARQVQAAGGMGVMTLATNVYFWAGLVLYGSMTIFWIWLLMRIPLTQAYPFVVLSFIFTPLLAIFFLGEQVNLWYLAAVGLIIAGLGLLVWKAPL